MNYEECKDFLEKIQRLGIKFGLDNVRAILSSFGNPQKRYPSLLVAGTNGKGSVCAMLSQILTFHGLRVGLYTSPHLIKVEERIQVGRTCIPSESFCRLLAILKQRIEELLEDRKLLSFPTYFEFLTCLAFLYFEEQAVDFAVFEVGMGGRFDATNVLSPVVSVITTVSRDHRDYLGKRLSQIAAEKAGIMKPGIPVVCGVEKGEALRTIRMKARELGSPFISVFKNSDSFVASRTAKGFRFRFTFNGEKYVFSPALNGEFQGRNGAVAIAVASVLSKRWRGFGKKEIIRGVERTQWEGRLEFLSRDPLIILDGAHNEEGARALSAYIQSFLSSPVILVFSIMKDKEIARVANILFPLAQKVILPRFLFPRAAPPEEISTLAKRFRDRITLVPDVGSALQSAVQIAGKQGCVLITGSLFFIGEVKRFLTENRDLWAL